MILLSLLPALVYLVLLKAMDVFSLIQWRRLSIALVYGMCCTFLVLAISRGYAWWNGSPWESVWISPLIEECLKAAPLLFLLAWRNDIAFLCEAMIYGAAVGAGFALVENGIYLYYYPEMSLITVIIRGFSTSLLHLGCTALVASIALLIMGYFHRGQFKSRLFILIALLPSWLLHTLHNSMLFDPLLQTFLVMAGMLLMFYLIAIWSERSTVDWLDVSITTHVQLLSAFKEGKLSETHAGHYLMRLKERCDAEVFFDAVVYLQLYMELVIEAKRQIMLHEVGMDEPLTDEQRALLSSKIIEFHALQQRIPLLLRQLIRPIIQYSQADLWAIERLL